VSLLGRLRRASKAQCAEGVKYDASLLSPRRKAAQQQRHSFPCRSTWQQSLRMFRLRRQSQLRKRTSPRTRDIELQPIRSRVDREPLSHHSPTWRASWGSLAVAQLGGPYENMPNLPVGNVPILGLGRRQRRRPRGWRSGDGESSRRCAQQGPTLVDGMAALGRDTRLVTIGQVQPFAAPRKSSVSSRSSQRSIGGDGGSP
jgi:hypothetical protein